MKRKATVAAGAVIERRLIKRWADRQKRDRFGSLSDPAFTAGYKQALNDLCDWLRDQPMRTKRPGGIGR